MMCPCTCEMGIMSFISYLTVRGAGFLDMINCMWNGLNEVP